MEPPVAEIVVWIVLAFTTWLVLMAGLNHFGVASSPLVTAPLSWLLARAVMSWVPELLRWASEAVTLIG
jgi:hypothetical protein